MVAVIDITDPACKLYAGTTLLATSPGFAIVEPHQLRIGETAASEWRRHPRHAVTGFWSRLSTDRMPITGYRAERWADLAWAQLQQLWERGQSREPQVVLAVPPEFTTEQLSILLGVAQHCDFQVVGMVNRLVAGWAGSLGQCPRATVLDISLQRSQLLDVQATDQQVRLTGQREYPDTGLLALQNSWVALIADRFIRETRFDPLHDGHSEQHVYLHLDQWLARLDDQPEIEIQIEHGNTPHRVAIERDAFLARTRERLQPLLEDIDGRIPLTLAAEIDQVPGIRAALRYHDDALRVVNAAATFASDAIPHAIHEHLDLICGGTAAVGYVDHLPIDPERTKVPQPSSTTAPSARSSRSSRSAARIPDHRGVHGPVVQSYAPDRPINEQPAVTDRATHVLIDFRAWPITRETLWIGQAKGPGRRAGSAGLPAHLCDLVLRDGQAWLESTSGAVLVNGVTVTTDHVLAAGDVIEAPGTGATLRAIQVQPDRDMD